MLPLPAIAPPDIILWATGYFRAALAARAEPVAQAAYVSDEVPNPRRPVMVVIESDGGPRLDMVRSAQRLRFQVWAVSKKDASDLALIVYALVAACPDGTPVCAVSAMAGPWRVADESGQPKQFLTCELIVKGADLP